MDVEKVTSDKERARNLLDTVKIRLDSIEALKEKNEEKFSSKIVEEYYESVFELVTAIMPIDGYKPLREVVEKHVVSIQYMRNYPEFTGHDIQLMDDLRKKRIGIKYYGLKVTTDYIKINETIIKRVIEKLKNKVEKKL